MNSAPVKKRKEPFTRPKLAINLKFEVAQKKGQQVHYEQVAELLEEMLSAVEKGYDYLPSLSSKPRKPRRTFLSS